MSGAHGGGGGGEGTIASEQMPYIIAVVMLVHARGSNIACCGIGVPAYTFERSPER
jgi:hypothetical protein